MYITATELNNRPGMTLESALREPVIIEKSGRPFVVMVSYERYCELEDSFWGSRAEQSEKTADWLSDEESSQFLQNPS